MPDLTYSLTLDGKTITNSSKTSFTLGGADGFTYEVSLYGLSFDRRIYQPGHIQAEILMTSSTEIKDVDAPNVDDLTACLLDKAVSLSVDGSEIAKGYYVHEIFPQIEKTFVRQETVHIMVAPITIKYYKFDIYVKLDIFSPDKKMMLNRFSRAYLGQRLIDDIVENGKDAFKCSLSVVSGVLNNLSYEEEVKGQTMHVELIHPYLVQYNESFYDFITRVANRCGEVFFFENGKLHFGISDKSAVTITEAARIVFERISDNPISIRDYARDTVKGKWAWEDEDDEKKERFDVTYKLGKKELISEPIDNENKGFPLDAFPRPEKPSSDYCHYYNSEVSSEDHYLLLYKDKFARDDFPDIWWGKTDEHLMEWLSDLLNSTSLLELLANFGKKNIELAIKCALKVGKANEKGNERLREAALDRNNDYAVLFSKVDNETKHWVTLDYYHDIRSHSEKQMRKMVCVDMGTGFINVHLGDKVTLPNDKGTTYVVVGVEMSSAVEWKRSYEVFSREPAAQSGVQSQRFYAIPMADSKFYPPLLPGSPFRQCGPQPAFVVDSNDPTSQGRIRVRYPWQQSTNAEEEEVNTTYKTKESARTDFEKYKSVFEKYAEFYVTPDYTDIENNTKLTDDEKKDEKKKRLKRLEEDTDPYDWLYKAKESSSEDSQEYIDAEKDYKKYGDEYRKAMNAWRAAKEKLLLAEAATPWIRMSTPMATQGGGMYFQPEVGDEVMVDYENGNIERPYVVGALYSKNLTAPGGNRMIVSRNGHTIKMDDPSDAAAFLEGLYPGFKFLSGYGVKLPGLEGKANKILGGIEMTDQLGFYNIKMSSHDRNISISSPFGDIDINALTGISINAPNGDISITGKNVDIAAFNKITFTSGRNVRMGIDKHRAGYFSSILNAKAVGKTIGKTFMAMTVGKFFDLSLIRTFLEIFIRPVDGTLEIKSGRYLLLESGEGKAAGEVAEYNVSVMDPMSSVFDSHILKLLVDHFKSELSSWVPDFCRKFNVVGVNLLSLNNAWTVPPGSNQHAPITTPATKAKLLEDMFAFDPKKLKTEQQVSSEFKKYKSDGKLAFDRNIDGNLQEYYESQIEALLKAVADLKRHVLSFDHLFEKVQNGSFVAEGRRLRFRARCAKVFVEDARSITTIDNPFVPAPPPAPAPPPPPPPAPAGAGPVAPAQVQAPATVMIPKYKDAFPLQAAAGLYSDYIQKVQVYCTNGQNKDDNLFDNPIQGGVDGAWLKFVLRRIFCMVIETCRDPKANPFDGLEIAPARYEPVNGQRTEPDVSFYPFSDADWAKYVQEIKITEPQNKQDALGKVGEVLGGVVDAMADSVSKIVPFESDKWSSEQGGKILLSEDKDKTIRFDAGGRTSRARPSTRPETDEPAIKSTLNSI